MYNRKNNFQQGMVKAIDEVYGTGAYTLEYYIKTHSKKGNKSYDPEAKNFIPKNELLRYRYGIDGYPKENLAQLGLRYNVSRERIRQIERKLLGTHLKTWDKPHKDAVKLQLKIKEYCNFDINDKYYVING